MTSDPNIARAYWRKNLQLVGLLLVIWFAVSLGAGVIFVDELNAFQLFGFPLGFWMAQQGSIFSFVILIFVYARRISHIEEQLGLSDKNEPDSYDAMNGEDAK